jgi:hypothetical protein
LAVSPFTPRNCRAAKPNARRDIVAQAERIR